MERLPHPFEARLGIGAAATGDTLPPTPSTERLVEEQQRLIQAPNSSNFHAVRQQQSQHHSGGKDHSAEQVGDTKDSGKDVQVNVLSEKEDHINRNIIDPQEEEKTKSLAKQKKSKEKEKCRPCQHLVCRHYSLEKTRGM